MRLPGPFRRYLELKRNVEDLRETVRFLAADHLRLNQLVLELLWRNDLKRGSTGNQTRDSFDYQWGEIPAGEAMPSNPEFLAATPQRIVEWTRLPAEWFKGKRVLDAGCGLGRWSYGLAKLGAHVTAIDQSRNALEATKKLVSPVGEIEILQKDLLNLDLPPASFDFVWSFGVAHHTENLLKAFANICQCVKPGGWLFMMLYGWPEDRVGFSGKADYEEIRQKTMHLSFAEKVEFLRKRYPAEVVHGYFDAISPLVNELVTFEWIQTFLQAQGFERIQRTVQHDNHHFVAQRKSA